MSLGSTRLADPDNCHGTHIPRRPGITRAHSQRQVTLLFLLIHRPSVSPTGCACRFLYGPETKDEHKAQVEKSLDGKIELKQEVIFYKKNGESGILIKSSLGMRWSACLLNRRRHLFRGYEFIAALPKQLAGFIIIFR